MLTSCIKTIERYIYFLLDQLLPASCLLCRLHCYHPISLCKTCQTLIIHPEDTNRLNSNPLPAEVTDPLWQRAVFLSPYETPIKELIHQGKFKHNLAALKTLGLLFAKYIASHPYDPELVLVPVPVHQTRLLERGYNQALELARPIAKTLNLRIDQRCLSRKDEASTQHLLNRQQRKHNTDNIFRINTTVPKKVAVIDDVFTTGETMRSICSCLNKAGTETIEVWIIARTLKQS